MAEVDEPVTAFRTRPLDASPDTFVVTDTLTLKIRERWTAPSVQLLVVTCEVAPIEAAAGQQATMPHASRGQPEGPDTYARLGLSPGPDALALAPRTP